MNGRFLEKKTNQNVPFHQREDTQLPWQLQTYVNAGKRNKAAMTEISKF